MTRVYLKNGSIVDLPAPLSFEYDGGFVEFLDDDGDTMAAFAVDAVIYWRVIEES